MDLVFDTCLASHALQNAVIISSRSHAARPPGLAGHKYGGLRLTHLLEDLLALGPAALLAEQWMPIADLHAIIHIVYFPSDSLIQFPDLDTS